MPGSLPQDRRHQRPQVPRLRRRDGAVVVLAPVGEDAQPSPDLWPRPSQMAQDVGVIAPDFFQGVRKNRQFARNIFRIPLALPGIPATLTPRLLTQTGSDNESVPIRPLPRTPSLTEMD